MKKDRVKIPSLWQNVNYLLLWSGQAVSATGSQVSQLAFPLLVLALTGSPIQAGLVGALRTIPYVVFSLPAGVLIDRWDRKRVMIYCDASRAISLASIPLAFAIGHLTLVQLYLVSLLEGTLFVFFNLAEVASLPSVVSREQLPDATAQNEIATATTTLLGPFLSGLLYSVNQLLPFAADAVSYAASIVSLSFIRVDFQKKRDHASRHLWLEIGEGLNWLWHQPLIRSMALLSSTSNLLSANYVLLIVVLAERMHASSISIGLIFTIGGVGGILGALVTPFIQRRLSFGQTMISSFWLWAGITALYALARNPWVLGGISFVLFLLWPICNSIQLSYRLALIPQELQGRVNSVFRLAAFSGQPIGLALSGWLIERVGIVPTVLLTAAGLALIALLGTLDPYIRHARPVTEIIPE